MLAECVRRGWNRRVGERRTLDRHLSRLGLCSRTVAAEFVRAGRVRLNGVTTRNPETWLDPEHDEVELDGKGVRAAKPLYLVLNKPKGFLTSFGDPRGRRTVYELLKGAPAWVFPVGRLDRDTSGLLLLTNDTELAERVTNPAFGLSKRYRATTRARVEPEQLAALAAGPLLDDGPTRPGEVQLVGHRGPTSVVELSIHEGRNHQVRRMFLAIGRPLKELRRTAIGPLELGELESGRWRALTKAELATVRSALGG